MAHEHHEKDDRYHVHAFQLAVADEGTIDTRNGDTPDDVKSYRFWGFRLAYNFVPAQITVYASDNGVLWRVVELIQIVESEVLLPLSKTYRVDHRYYALLYTNQSGQQDLVDLVSRKGN